MRLVRVAGEDSGSAGNILSDERKAPCQPRPGPRL